MSSVRAQILQAVATKLESARVGLDWQTLLVNPRAAIGEDQFNALVLMYGGDRRPEGLTGNVEQRVLEFTVVLLVCERGTETAEQLLDAGYVAINDLLTDPDDIQLSGLCVGISQAGITDPTIGYSDSGARVIGGQAVDFAVQYLAREGDASSPAP